MLAYCGAEEAAYTLAKVLSALCQQALLKLGQTLHETPFSNRNHEKKRWFCVVFTQNQVKLCGSVTFWLGARERSLCLVGSCFMFHVPFGSVSQTWNLGFIWGVQNEQNAIGMKSGADEDSSSFIRATPLSWVTVCSYFLSTFLLERIFYTVNSSLGFSKKEQNY